MVIWDKEKIDLLIECVADASNLKEASCLFKQRAGEDVTPSSIRAALQRHRGLCACDVKKDAEQDETRPDTNDKPEISQDLIKQMKVMYAAKSSGGMGMTAFDIAVSLQDQTDIPLTTDMVRKILKEEGQTKGMIPDVVTQNMEMLREERESLKRKVLNSPAYQRDYVKSLEKRVEELESYEQLRSLAKGDLDFRSKTVKVDFPKGKSKAVLVFPVSDVHSGAVWDGLKGNKYYQKHQQEYNARVMAERQDRLHHAWIKMLMNPSKVVGEVHYLSLGDDLEGLYANLRNGQFLDQDSAGYEQFARVRDFHLNNILALLSMCSLLEHRPKLRVTFTPGNHDRLYQDKSYNSENFMAYLLADLVNTNHMLRSQISEYGTSLVEVEAAVPMISYVYEDLNVCLLAHHGHLFNIKTDKDITNLAHLHGVSSAERFVMIQAHLHHFKAVQASNCKYIYNPSYCGNTGYSSINIQKGAPAQAIGILIDERDELILGPYSLE